MRPYVRWLMGLLLAALCVGCQRQEIPSRPPASPRRLAVRPARADRPASRATVPLSIRLERATLTWRAGTLDVVCHVVLENRTGSPLGMLTNFGSVFDGFAVILRLSDRGLLARQGYTHHQSPFAVDRTIVVGVGKTSAALHFPIGLRRKPRLPLEVELVGGLRGSTHARPIRSNARVVRALKTATP